ncbi:MAG: hypothetical protein JXA25_02420 [Anaerolineales bacterium]|nr:hypothetical protein [Anaerolineales bacterium]
MKQQKGTPYTTDSTNEMKFGKINDQHSSWSNAWCAVWETQPETRTNGKNASEKKNPSTQEPTW